MRAGGGARHGEDCVVEQGRRVPRALVVLARSRTPAPDRLGSEGQQNSATEPRQNRMGGLMRSESLEDVFGTKQPAEPSADNADPMAAVLSKVQDLVASARETDDESSRARHTEAREIRDRLPRFLRGGTSAEL